MLLKTSTVVGTGVLNFAAENNLVKTSRNCSSFVATSRRSLSLALPTNVKFVVCTRSQLSLACEVNGAQKPRRKNAAALADLRAEKGEKDFAKPLTMRL